MHELSKTVGAVVADDYRTAAVFERYGIDFCCGGQRLLGEICKERNLDPQRLIDELVVATASPVARSENYAAWDTAFLVDYIVQVHHGYLKEQSGQIVAYARKVAEVHGNRHPEVIEIAERFAAVVDALAPHLRREEETVFPALKRAAAEDAVSLREEVAQLVREHEEVGEQIHALRRLAKDYTLPPDACTTFALSYQKLREFEDDLHKHVHLENNILFPRATGQ